VYTHVVTATLALATAAGCHVTRRSSETIETSRSLRPLPGTAKPLAPEIRLTDDGRLRFVEPLECAAEIAVEGDRYDTVEKQANLATVVVGIIVASIGGVSLFAGLSSDDGDAAAVGGVFGVAAGAPLAIAPFFGREKTREPAGRDSFTKPTSERTACGDAPIAGDTATIAIGSQRVLGTVDAEGTFSVPVFEFYDAFDIPRLRSLQLTATIHHELVPRTIKTTLDAETLAVKRDGFFAASGIDGSAPPLQRVPSLSFDGAHAIHDGDAVTVDLHVANAGPGPARGVRAHVQSRWPHLDGRVLYIGKLAAGADTRPSLRVRVPEGGVPPSTIVTIRLDDADDTAPSYSVHASVTRPLKTIE
jgi:hypothetical protein